MLYYGQKSPNTCPKSNTNRHVPHHFVTFNMESTGGLFIASHQECTLQFAKAHSEAVYDKEITTDYIEHTWVIV